MKKIVSITLLSLLLFSCKNSTETNNETTKNEISENEFKTSNPITVDFTNEINGFKVRAIWLIESLDSRYTEKLIGPAILTFTDVKTNKTYNVNHDGFSIDILPENEKFIKIVKNEGVEEYQSNASFTQKMEFKLPEIIVEQNNAEITSKDRNSGYKDYVPFFFKDIDFDNKPDLILTLAYFSEKVDLEMKYIKVMNTVLENLTTVHMKNFQTFLVMRLVIVLHTIKLQLITARKEFTIIGCQVAVCVEKKSMNMIKKMVV